MPHYRSRAQLGLALCVTACLVAGTGFASPTARAGRGLAEHPHHLGR